MKASESTTMFIDFSHVMSYNNVLQKAVSEEYLRLRFSSFSVLKKFKALIPGFLRELLLIHRFEPYLKNACKRFVTEQKPTFIADDNPNKDINVAFFNLPVSKRYITCSLTLSVCLVSVSLSRGL